MSKPDPWLIETKHVSESIEGNLFDALVVAAQLLLISSEWPKKGRVVTSAKISRGNKEPIFNLVLETPERIESESK